jgi:1-acyl-sn-glycerol-3-phosphate acyltransferase
MDTFFEDWGPYRDEEVAPAMRRIMESPYFPGLAGYIYPRLSLDEVRGVLEGFSSADDFHSQTMRIFIEQVIRRSINHFTCTGIEELDPGERYLFVSNHRDILLDSSLFQHAFRLAGYRTVEVAFASSLVPSPLTADISRLNKMFRFARRGNLREYYANALLLSRYIHHAMEEKGESVWIAQRNERTKIGIDSTDQGIVKMLYMRSPQDPVATLASLRIVPVSISYTWEPCDILKALECCREHRQERCSKRPGTDLQHMLAGITARKGDVHLHVGKPITEDKLAPFAHHEGPKFNRRVAMLIDRHILENYRLTCNNFVAHDFRARSKRFSKRYSSQDRERFISYFNGIQEIDIDHKPLFNRFLLGIYANPIDTRERLDVPV